MYECPTTQPMSEVVNIVSPGLAAVDVLHRARQRDRVAAGVALHALRPAGRARGVEDVRRLARFEPRRPAPASSRCRCAQRRVIEVAPGDELELRVDAAVDDDDLRRRRLARAGSPRRPAACRGSRVRRACRASAVNMSFRPRVVDARGEARRREAAEHDRMDRADAARTRASRTPPPGSSACR